jgi:dTDP-4-amino-4,6-dideoxygalactose transaminase
VKIPLLDLRAQFETIRDEVTAALERVFAAQQFIMGPEVQAFEDRMTALCGVRHAVACASGTDALLLSLRTLDLRPGDEVITSPFTFFATAGAIHNAGGRPVFVDIEAGTFNLSPDAVRAAVTPRTRALLPVHLFGQMAAMETMLETAAAHGLAVIEDAAQAIGARRRIGGVWRRAGELGTTGAFSFFPSKNLGAWGDGGMIVTQDAALAERLRRLRTHGGAKQYHHDEIGTNSRLDTVQAAVLLVKLDHLDAWTAARRERAAYYDAALRSRSGVSTPTVDGANEHVYHQYTIRADRRDDLKRVLAERGVGSAVYYPVALHRQPCFAALGYRAGAFPEAERATREVLSLPVYPELTRAQQDEIVAAIAEFYA